MPLKLTGLRLHHLKAALQAVSAKSARHEGAFYRGIRKPALLGVFKTKPRWVVIKMTIKVSVRAHTNLIQMNETLPEAGFCNGF